MITSTNVSKHGKHIVDLYRYLSSMRQNPDNEIIALWELAFNQNATKAIRILFHVRDIQYGYGKRRVFRCILHWLKKNNPYVLQKIMYSIPKYGRWDDFIYLLCKPSNADIDNAVVQYIKSNLTIDLTFLNNNDTKRISNCAKWMPSENASSKQTRALARKLMHLLGMSPKEYRTTLSKLRKALKITEHYITNKNYEAIEPEYVTIGAFKKYINIFIKNPEKFNEYINCIMTKRLISRKIMHEYAYKLIDEQIDFIINHKRYSCIDI